jgi:DNA-binding transcriptional MocR family regulator
VERNVLFTPGRHFTPDGEACGSCLRLNFSHASEADADHGLANRGDILRRTDLAA